MTPFIHTQKQKQLLMKVALMMYSNQSTIILNIQISFGKGSGRIIDSVIEHNINKSKYNPLAGSSYIKLAKELNHPRIGLINIQNIDDNECFKWFLVRYLHPADRTPARITKADKDCLKKIDFKDLKFPVNARDIHKIENKNLIDINVFGYENKKKISNLCIKKTL